MLPRSALDHDVINDRTGEKIRLLGERVNKNLDDVARARYNRFLRLFHRAIHSQCGPGFALYDSRDAGRLGPWLRVGGTSAGAPQWVGFFAIAAEARNYMGRLLFSTQQALAALYRLPQGDFHDITSGSNGFYTASVGYELVTGRGSPLADRIVRDLAMM
jgi:hypothetical protein